MGAIEALAGGIVRGLRASPAKDPVAVGMAPSQGRVGKANTRLYRSWSRGSTWVRAAINIRNDQIATAEWDIVPVDPEKRYSVRLQQQLRDLFHEPNPVDKNWANFISKVNEDVLALDAGVVEKDRSLDGQVRRLWADDGADFKINALWDGDPRETRYWWCPGGSEPKESFLDRDVVYLMMNPQTNTPLGVSPLETLKQVIEDILYGADYNARQVRGAAPDGALDLGEGASEKQVSSFRQYWMSEIAGKGAIAFLGGSKNAKFIPFRGNNREMQFIEWNIFLVRQVAVVYGLSAQELSLTMDINRATSQTEEKRTEDRALRTSMAKTQDYLTEGVVWDEGFGGKDNNLAFRFTRLNLKESKDKADINQIALAGVGWKTVDEARTDDGRPPVGGKLGGGLVMKLANGVVVLDPNDMPTAREYLELMANKNGGAADGESPEEPADGSQPPEAP